jgi:hypothetical protein
MSMRSRGSSLRFRSGLVTVAATAGLVLVGATPAPAAPAHAAPHPVTPRAAKASTPLPGSFVPLTSQRLLDTRTGAPLAPRATRSLAVAGQDGMPTTGVGTVVLTVTAVSDPSGGYLTIYGDGAARPTVASLNYAGGYARSNEVFTQLGTNGAVAIYNGADTSTNVTIDVAGYYLAGGAAGGSFVPVAPTRLLDTRTGAKPTARGERWVTIAGSGGLPAQVSAVVLNVAALQPTRSGHLDLDADARPGYQSAVFFRAAQSVSNLAIVTLDEAGRLALINQAQGNTGFTVDVFGYFVTGAPAAAGLFGPNLSEQLFDTRGVNRAGPHVPIPGRGSIDVAVSSISGGVPASASAVTLIVTAINDTAAGYLTDYPTGSARPTTATLDFVAKYNISDTAIVAPGKDGKITFFNGSLQPVDITVSAVGYVGAVPGPLRWTSPKQIDPGWQLFSMSCPSASFCLAIDFENQYLTFNGVDWTAPAPTGLTGYPGLVSCSSPTFCLALFRQVDGLSGPSEIYRNGVWSTGPPLTLATYYDHPADLSCASPSFCVAVGGGGDDQGYEWMYDGTNWSAVAHLSSSEELSSVSCVSAQFCLVAGQGPEVERYDGQTWTETTIGVNTYFSNASSFASCTSTTFCLVTSGQASQAYNGSSWGSPLSYDKTSNFISVRLACAGVSSCAGLSADGAVGFDTASGWTDFANLGLPGRGEAIQCGSPSLCIVFSGNGYVSVGTPL